MKNLTSTGIRKGHSGVTGEKIDSRVLSQKNEEISLASKACVLASRKMIWRQKQQDWRHKIANWRQKRVFWRYYRKFSGFKGVRGTPRQDLAFRAHEMRILRRSIERPLSQKKGAAYGKTKGRKCNTKAL